MTTTTATRDLATTDHAEQRWLQRVGFTPPLDAAIDEAIPVGAKHVDGQTLLHPPTGTLLVYKRGTVVTVLHAVDGDLNDDHLVTCEACDSRWHPGQTATCPWCDGGGR